MPADNETAPADSGLADSGPADSGPADSGPADSGLADSGLADPGLDEQEHVTPERAAPGERAKAAVAALATAEQVAGGAKPDPILVANNVVRTFGGLTAVDVAHVEFQRGAITALIGPNGAGKTTFFNLLTGFDKADTGDWQFNGDEISKLAPHKVARRGMVRTFQLTKSLARMTVLENLRLGAKDQLGEKLWSSILPFLWREQEKEVTGRADELLKHFNLVRVRDDFAGSLSGGQRKLLEMARALMVGPDMVMLDEPMAGVNPRLRQTLNEHIRGLRETGMTVVFVEHDMDVVRDVSDWVVVMAQGQIVAEGPPEDVMAQEAVIDAYLGAHHNAPLTLEEEEAQLQAAYAADEQEEKGTS